MLSVVADADDRHLGALHHGNNLLQRDVREGMHPEQCIIHVHVNERCRRKEGSKQGHTNNKAKQHSTPKAVTFKLKVSCLGWDTYMHMLI